MILLSRRQAKHGQHPLAHHRLDGPAIPPNLTSDQIIQLADLLVEAIEVHPRPRS
jgi:hypothetical protein